MADFQADVPKQTDELLQFLSEGLVRVRREKNQQVGVGAGEKLLASVTANGDERAGGRQG